MSTQETNLKAIADAIREKEGSTALIPAEDFPARILALETGGLPDGVCTIDVQASDPAGGTVSGGGVASKGIKLTVEAKEKDGFNFIKWIESGVDVAISAGYTFNVEQNRNLTAVFEEIPSRLPSGYTEVEYIEGYASNSSALISTDVTMDFAKTRLLLDVWPNDGSTSRVLMIAGSQGSAPKIGMVGVSASGNFCYNIQNSGLKETTIAANSRVIIDLNCPSKRLSIGNRSFSLSLSSGTGLTIVLGSSGNSSKSKIYSAKIYTSGNLSRDLVPCKDASGIAGMYDLVEKNFYSKGGYFVAGPAV